MDEVRKRRIAAKAEKELTNYFNKKTNETMNTLKNAMTDRINVSIVNTAATPADVALNCGTIPTEGVHYLAGSGEGAVPVLTFHKHDLSMIHKIMGNSVDAIVDDMNDAEYAAASVKIACSDKSMSLRQQLEYLRQNARYIKEIVIQSNDRQIFDLGKITVGSVDPFGTSRTRDLELKDFLSVNQYDSSKVSIPFAFGEEAGLQWNADLLMVLRGIPAASQNGGSTVNTNVSVSILFYGE